MLEIDLDGPIGSPHWLSPQGGVIVDPDRRAKQIERWRRERAQRSLGEAAGHPFRGNQWTPGGADGLQFYDAATDRDDHGPSVTLLDRQLKTQGFVLSQRSGNAIVIMQSDLAAHLRGKGIGASMYLETARRAHALGLPLRSTTSPSPSAIKMWESLVSSGAAQKITQHSRILKKDFLVYEIPVGTRSLGEAAGHPFRGNQWTEGVSRAESFISDVKASGGTVLFHSGDASIDHHLSQGIVPQHGEWLDETLGGATDSEETAAQIREQNPVAFYSTAPSWVSMKAARKLNKPVSEITLDDIRQHGQLSIVEASSDFYRADGNGGAKQIGGRGYTYEHDTGLGYSSNDLPYGVESRDIFTHSEQAPGITLVGNDLIQFLSRNYPNELPVVRRHGSGRALRGNANSGNHGHAGRDGKVGGSASRAGFADPSTIDSERLKALRLPPAWTNVQVAVDPKSALQAVGTDAKGRSQYVYSAAHSEQAASQKFARLKSLNDKLPALREKLAADLTHDDPAIRDTAIVLSLIEKTGFRIGGNADTGGDKHAYGASTLLAKHVKITGDTLTFNYIGKKGVRIKKKLDDGPLARAIEPKLGTGPLFPNTSDAQVRLYMKEHVGDFKVKDLRTWQGTNTALRAIKIMRVPTTDAAFKKAQRDVAKVVAAHLGNTPAVALSAYIDPAVWGPWRKR